MSDLKHDDRLLRKLLRNAPAVYFALLLVLAGSSAYLSLHDYDFIVINPTIWFLLGLLLQTIFAAACMLRFREHTVPAVVLSQFLPVLACIYYYFTDSLVSLVPANLIAFHALLYVLPGYVISLLGISPKPLRIIAAAINTVLMIGFSLLFLLAITFGSMTQQKAFRGKLSPDGLYMVTVISSDSGAVGGGTMLALEEVPSSIRLGCGRLAKLELIYSGEWNEYQHISYYWKDDHTLLINGIEYPLPDLP